MTRCLPSSVQTSLPLQYSQRKASMSSSLPGSMSLDPPVMVTLTSLGSNLQDCLPCSCCPAVAPASAAKVPQPQACGGANIGVSKHRMIRTQSLEKLRRLNIRCLASLIINEHVWPLVILLFLVVCSRQSHHTSASARTTVNSAEFRYPQLTITGSLCFQIHHQRRYSPRLPRLFRLLPRG